MIESQVRLFFMFLFFFLLGMVVVTACVGQDVQIKPVSKIRIVTAEWCGPCQVLKKHLKDDSVKELLELYDNELVDFDKNPDFVKKHKVTHVPTIIIIKNGKVVYKRAGVPSITKLKSLLRLYQ